MRNWAVGVAVVIGLVVFIGGGALAYFHPDYKNLYIVVTGIVGGAASVIGLIGLFASRRLTGADIKDVEADLFKQLADTKDRTDKYTRQAAQTKEEIDRLARDKAELELLIRQASLKVFLEERLRATSEEIERRVAADHNLVALIADYEGTAIRVTEISGALAKSPNADKILDILKEISSSDRAKAPHLLIRFGGIELDIAPALRAIANASDVLANAFVPFR